VENALTPRIGGLLENSAAEDSRLYSKCAALAFLIFEKTAATDDLGNLRKLPEVAH
jgi:hypothetical protein